MHYLVFSLFVALNIFCSGESYAQAAYDTACYFPKMGNPNELDTIYGGQADQNLGAGLTHLPPLTGERYDRLVMKGLPGNIPNLTSVETGPDFDLHKLSFVKKYPYVFKKWASFVEGHFHTPKLTDLLFFDNSGVSASNAIIYWADENGDFDTSRYTSVFPFDNRHMNNPYVAKLTSDSVDDIVMNVAFFGSGLSYMALVKGGQKLYNQGKIAGLDDTVFWARPPYGQNIDTNVRWPSQADWRGVGREDLITIDNFSNLYYYRNYPPFDLHKFVDALQNDTLLKPSEWSLYTGKLHGTTSAIHIQALPRPPWDKSTDLLVTLPIEPSSDQSHEGICVYKGGPEFGTKRLSLDTSDFFLHTPAYYSADFSQSRWPVGVADLGDLTGTGNRVLATSGGGGLGYSFVALYVLGKAIDDKIDCFMPFRYGGGSADTIRATTKEIPTLIMGAPAYVSPEDQDKGIASKGSVRILLGSEKIPVHLNPKFSVSEHHALDTSRHHLLAFPNPCNQSTVLTFDNCTGGKMIVDVISSSGEYCQQEETPGGYGIQQYAVFLNNLAAGNYIVRLSCLSDGWSTTTNIIKTGAAQVPWKFDLHKMMGR